MQKLQQWQLMKKPLVFLAENHVNYIGLTNELFPGDYCPNKPWKNVHVHRIVRFGYVIDFPKNCTLSQIRIIGQLGKG
jgi:hypothetical protein